MIQLQHHIDRWLRRFSLDPHLHEHTAAVLLALPEPVRLDLISDPNFTLCDYEPSDGQPPVHLCSPQASCTSRCVVLKRTLRERSPQFVRWLIAHELAHAHLRNEGRWHGDDPEHAADALAAQWGFPRPPRH